jgi:hypothetical protein
VRDITTPVNRIRPSYRHLHLVECGMRHLPLSPMEDGLAHRHFFIPPMMDPWKRHRSRPRPGSFGQSDTETPLRKPLSGCSRTSSWGCLRPAPSCPLSGSLRSCSASPARHYATRWLSCRRPDTSRSTVGATEVPTFLRGGRRNPGNSQTLIPPRWTMSSPFAACWNRLPHPWQRKQRCLPSSAGTC